MTIEEFCERLVAATVTGVYQGIILIVLVGLLLRLLTRTNAATRHAVWFATLWLVVLIIPAHDWLSGAASGQRAGTETDSEAVAPVSSPVAFSPPPAAMVPAPFDAGLPVAEEKSSVEAFPEPPLFASPALQSPGALASAPLRSDIDGRISAFLGFPTLLQSVSSWKGVLQPVSWSWQSGWRFPIAAVLVSVWLGIATIRLAYLVLRLVRLRNLKDGASCPRPELQALFERLRLNISRNVGLLVSDRQRSPLVLGFVRPIVLIPSDLAAQPDLTEAQHVLTHELAHVRRFDDWANLAQHFVQAVLFFHPAVWWINRKLSLEREIACDDYVLQQTSGPRSYALVLTSVAKRISQSTPVLAPGVLNSNSQLQQRISMILNTRRNSSPALAKTRLASILSAAAAVGIAAVYLGPRVVFAETPSPSPVTDVQVRVDAHPIVHPVPAVLVAVEADEPSVPTPPVEPGPKFKPDGEGEPIAVITPGTPDAPDFDGPRPPHVARMSKPGKTPRSPESLDGANDRDGSMEDRVRRLEKMVQELVSLQKAKHVHADVHFKDGENDQDDFMIQKQDLDRNKASAERQAARAAELAQRATEQAKRITKDLQARLEQDQQGQGEFREAFQKQLEALRKARENLGQEMERLDHQIEKLEKERQHSEKDRSKDQRRSDVSAEKLQAQVNWTPEPALAK